MPSLTQKRPACNLSNQAPGPFAFEVPEGPMTVLYFVVGAIIGIPLALFAIVHFHARHHRRVRGTTMWQG